MKNLHRYCERTRFLALATDTTFINEKRFELLAQQERFAANRIYGAMLRKMQPFRPGGGGGEEEHRHHAVTVEDYPWSFYPPFVRGPSYVISGDVIPRLLGRTDGSQRFPILSAPARTRSHVSMFDGMARACLHCAFR